MRFLTSLGLMYEDGRKKPDHDQLKRSIAQYHRGELTPMPAVEPRSRDVVLSQPDLTAIVARLSGAVDTSTLDPK